MTDFVNPFEPNMPASPAMFAGREEELRQLRASLKQTHAGIPSHFAVIGDRGTGKSSLLSYLRFVAENSDAVDGGRPFLVITVAISTRTTQQGLVDKIERALEVELGKHERFRQYLKEAWTFVRKIEAAGVKLPPGAREPNGELLIENLATALANLVARVCAETAEQNHGGTRFGGILLLLDEVDNASTSLDIGTLLKLLAEELLRQSCTRLMIVAAGLPRLLDVLKTSHPSAPRTFPPIRLGALLEDDVKRVLQLGLQRAGEINRASFGIEETAIGLIQTLSEGHPHFVQQFAHSAFESDSDCMIGVRDVGAGTRKALRLIGDRYFRGGYYRVQSDSARAVLHIMADRSVNWISKEEIRAKFKGGDDALDSAIQALREYSIILSRPGGRGVYRLPHTAFAAWIKMMEATEDAVKRAEYR